MSTKGNRSLLDVLLGSVVAVYETRSLFATLDPKVLFNSAANASIAFSFP